MSPSSSPNSNFRGRGTADSLTEPRVRASGNHPAAPALKVVDIVNGQFNCSRAVNRYGKTYECIIGHIGLMVLN